MPQLTIGDKTVTVGDEFLQLSPDQQNAAVAQIAGQLGAKPAAVPAAPAEAPAPDPVTVNSVVRSAATGVPIVGGLLNKLDAATNAALAPALNRFFAPENQLQGETFSERYDQSLRQQEGADKKFATEHPIVDTAAQIAGGVASIAPVMAAAPKAFGLTGNVWEMAKAGAISGAALSGADAAVRGHDVAPAATVGGIIGGAAGPVGKGVGKVVSAVADRVRPSPAAPQNVAKVGDVEIPLSQSQVTQNPALSAEEQILLRGGRGEPAQMQAQGFRDLQDARVNQARDEFAASLDPTGSAARTAPQDAAERIAAELIAQEQAQQAARAREVIDVRSAGDRMAHAMDPAGQMRGATPFDAAENLSDAFGRARNTARADYRGKYRDVSEAPGEFAPGSAAGFRGDVEAGLRNADNPVSLDPTNTTKSLSALQIIDDNLNAVGPGARPAQARPGAPAPTVDAHAQNVADIRAKYGDDVAAAYNRQKQVSVIPAVETAASATAGEEVATAASPAFTMRDVEQVRKQLSTLYSDARRAMMAGGSGADVNALEQIMEQFDTRVSQMIQQGKFAGDGPAVLQMQEAARASFADYKQKFSRRGSGDTIGAAVEKILGRFSDTKATPDEVVKLAYGGTSMHGGPSPGGQMPVQIAQRILKIFGRDSSEFGTYKQGLFAFLTKGEPAAVATQIDTFLNGTKGKLLARTVFEPGERIELARYANRLRGIAPIENEPGAVAAAIRRYSGADGAPPASANKIINDLMGATGKGSGVNAPLIAADLKRRLSPENWSALRQGVWEKLTNAGEGKIPFEAQALSQRLHEFLNESGSQLSKVLFSPRELELMGQLAAVYKQMIPVKGTTNPSGTAPMLAKIANGARQSLLPLLGFNAGGLPGAAVAFGIDKGLGKVANANAARKATKLFYGPQASRPVDPRFAKGAGLLSQGALPALNQGRSR